MYGVVATVFIWKAFVAPRKHKLPVCVGLIALGLAMVTGLYSASDTFRKRADQTLLALKGSRQAINDATSERVAVFESAWNIFRDYPINGVGAHNYRKLSAAYWPKDIQCIQTSVLYPHQLILEYASETGLIGLTGLAASFFLCIRWWRRADKETRRTSAGYALTLLALYFPLNTHRSIFSSELACSLWILIALYTVAIHKNRE
jgi:O-antigen ligase